MRLRANVKEIRGPCDPVVSIDSLDIEMVASASRATGFQNKIAFDRASSFKKGLVLVTVPLIGEILCIAVLVFCLSSARHDLQILDHERRVMFYLKSIDMAVARALLPLSEAKDITDIRTRLGTVETLRDSLPELNKLDEFDPSVKAALQQANDMLPRVALFIFETEARSREEGMTHRKFISEGRKDFLGLIFEFGDFSRSTVEAESATKIRTAEQLHRIRFFLLSAIGSILFVNLLITIFLVRFFTKDTVLRLNRVAENAQRLAAGKALYPSLTDSDEIGALDRELFAAAKVLGDSRRKELAVLDSASDAICWLDQNLRFVLVSKAAENIWQCKLEDLLGSSLLITLDDASIEATRESFQVLRETGKLGMIENRVKLPNDKRSTLSWKVVWSEQRKGFFCVARDITSLRAVQLLKESFLAMVSHDIRSPLALLAASTELVLAGKKGHISAPQQAELLKVNAGTRHLKHLADELLDLGKLEAAKEPMRMKPVHAFNACQASKEALRISARQSSVTFVGPVKDALVLADEKRLTQAVTNLLANALKVTPVGGKIVLSIEKVGDRVEISVRDQGAGIAPDDLPLIFQKFQRRGNDSQETGLELVIAKAVVQALDGKLGVRNEESGGTTFWISLPCAPLSQDDSEPDSSEDFDDLDEDL